jgi:hypothetical protein
VNRLRPGERMVDGRVFYSAAWLRPQPTESDKGEGRAPWT